MQKDIELRLPPQQAADMQSIKTISAKLAGINPTEITSLKVLRRSIDARQRSIFINLKVRLFIGENNHAPEFEKIEYKDVSGCKQAIVVGCGPAGLFAALRLIELGIRPVVVERGKNVRDRKRDTALISTNHKVNPESNYCFGEGGAGAYSDGKLYTRSKKRGDVDKILRVFCQYGASSDILVNVHPHIGTDKLPAIIENMRKQIEQCGGEVHFETRMDSFIIKENEVKGINTHNGKTFEGKVILATGHSARDVYYQLHNENIKIEAKGLAIGVRIEHPATLIDQIFYHNREGRGKYLPAAEYSFAVQSKGRGVYSFCMCPGGIIVPAASGNEQLVVNGMSPSNRGTQWSNAGVVVEVHPEDFPKYAKYNDLAMIKLVEDIEKDTWIQGGKTQTAPVQRMADFTAGKKSSSLPKTSYAPGIISSELHRWIPSFVTSRLQDAFRQIGKRHYGYLTNEALLLAVESRTSSPVRVPRNRETFEHITIKGLYPCGEGAGYAGGIVSAAMDGERCAESLAKSL